MSTTDRILALSRKSKELGRQYDGWLTAIAIGLAKIVLDIRPTSSPVEANCPAVFRQFLEDYLGGKGNISRDEVFLMLDCFHSMREMVIDPDSIHCNEELMQVETLRLVLDSVL